jgi:hypothetical protein
MNEHDTILVNAEAAEELTNSISEVTPTDTIDEAALEAERQAKEAKLQALIEEINALLEVSDPETTDDPRVNAIAASLQAYRDKQTDEREKGNTMWHILRLQGGILRWEGAEVSAEQMAKLLEDIRNSPEGMPKSGEGWYVTPIQEGEVVTSIDNPYQFGVGPLNKEHIIGTTAVSFSLNDEERHKGEIVGNNLNNPRDRHSYIPDKFQINIYGKDLVNLCLLNMINMK